MDEGSHAWQFGDQMVPVDIRRFQCSIAGLILGLRPANERRRYFVTPSLIGWAQT